MSVSYQAVGWNAFKKRYDAWLGVFVLAFIGLFIGVGLAVQPAMTLEILLLRAFGVAALLLLHLVLVIGPLCRLNRRWLPLLYNRRHLGVTMFMLALLHGLFALLTYHVGSDMNPIVSVFVTDSGPRVTSFPFQALGFIALLILLVMAVTSHDFWLVNLTAPVWKTLHMGVYLAYLLLIGHVAFGVLQAETSLLYVGLVAMGLLMVGGLHLLAGWRGGEIDAEPVDGKGDFMTVCRVEDLVENEPLGAVVAGERVAVILYEGNKVSCVSGVCQHQNGPLAEGRFKHGCLSCPWHGYQYQPEDGCSPEPFTERIPTFDVMVSGDHVKVRTRPNPSGKHVTPARVGERKPHER